MTDPTRDAKPYTDTAREILRLLDTMAWLQPFAGKLVSVDVRSLPKESTPFVAPQGVETRVEWFARQIEKVASAATSRAAAVEAERDALKATLTARDAAAAKALDDLFDDAPALDSLVAVGREVRRLIDPHLRDNTDPDARHDAIEDIARIVWEKPHPELWRIQRERDSALTRAAAADAVVEAARKLVHEMEQYRGVRRESQRVTMDAAYDAPSTSISALAAPVRADAGEPDITARVAFGAELMELAGTFGAKFTDESHGFDFAEGLSIALAKCGLRLAHGLAPSRAKGEVK